MRVLPLGVAVLAVGCAPPFIVTDSFTEAPTGLFAGPVDKLHDYVVGTSFSITVRAGRAFVDLKNTQVVSKNPDLIEVLEQSFVEDRLEVRLHAIAEGTAALAFVDQRQRPLEERVILIKLPDEIDLAVNVDPEKKFTVPVIATDNLLVAVAGVVTFRVTYKRDGSEVKGTGVLVGDSEAFAIENPTRIGPDREFVTLRAGDQPADLTDVRLSVADTVIETLRVRTADPSEIASVQLDEGELPSWKNDGDIYTVWAKAFTTSGAPVFGAQFAWTFDSAPIEGTGDLLSYTRQGSERRLLQTRAGDATKDLTIEARAGTARVGTSADPGCASFPAPLVFALLALAARRKLAQR